MSHQNKISPFDLQILKIFKHKNINVSPDDPSLPNRVKILIKTELVTQIRFSKINRIHQYSVEFKPSESTYPWLLNFTVEQNDVYSWVDFFSTDNGKIFEFKIQSLDGPKQIEFITQNKQFNFLPKCQCFITQLL